MADISNLTQFLTDVANAIKGKKGITDKIPAANFDTEINSINTGIDTSDATASEKDIVKGKTAYVNGSKLTGTIEALASIKRLECTVDIPDGTLQLTSPYGSTQNPYFPTVGALDTNTYQIIVKIDEIYYLITSSHPMNYQYYENTGNSNFWNIRNGKQYKLANGQWVSSSIPGVTYETDRTIWRNGRWDDIIQGANYDIPYTTNKSQIWYTKNTDIGTVDSAFVNLDTQLILSAPETNVANTIGLTADKIIKGNTILGVEGTAETSENLQEQLDAQDTIIKELQTSLDNKASSTDIKPNIFMQETEPVKKEGIWLKGNYQVDNIVADENIFVSEEWNTTKMSSLKVIPYNFYNGSVVSIGTDIYLFGSDNSRTTAYKYDTSTDTYTSLTNIPYEFHSGSAVSIGTDIYLFGGTGGNTKVYKYNTSTDTYTQLTNIPYEFYYGSVVSVGTNVYLFGGYGRSTAYKYDTLTDTYTQLTNIPYNFYNGSAVFTGIDIYLLGGEPNQTKVQVMSMIPNDYGNNSIVISQGGCTKNTNIANYGIQNAKFYYDRVYYQDENGNLLSTIPTYNGNGKEWIKISGGEG